VLRFHDRRTPDDESASLLADIAHLHPRMPLARTLPLPHAPHDLPRPLRADTRSPHRSLERRHRNAPKRNPLPRFHCAPRRSRHSPTRIGRVSMPSPTRSRTRSPSAHRTHEVNAGPRLSLVRTARTRACRSAHVPALSTHESTVQRNRSPRDVSASMGMMVTCPPLSDIRSPSTPPSPAAPDAPAYPQAHDSHAQCR
jgi:hypothetical protein